MCQKINDFIYWPRGNDMIQNKIKFEKLRKIIFPGVVGCIDGTYIPIKGKKSEQISYCTRKKFPAMILQAICDSEYKFIDIFVGWPGSSHDARVWRNSPIYHKISNDSSMIPTDCHLLGDSAYPLDSYLMVPYKDNGFLTTKQKFFNKRLSSTRSVIEQTFGLLKCRFRRLKYLDAIHMERITKVIVTACILHNICISASDILHIDEECNNDVDHSNSNNEATQIGITKRDQIADHLIQYINGQN